MNFKFPGDDDKERKERTAFTRTQVRRGEGRSGEGGDGWGEEEWRGWRGWGERRSLERV